MPSSTTSSTLGGLKSCNTNEDGEPVVKISPAESVFSFFLFMAPIEELRAPGKITTPKCLAWLVMIIALTLQGVVIYAVWKVIVLGEYGWQLSVVNEAPDSRGSCWEGQSLCQELHNGMVTCAPPSVQLAGRWTLLDKNGDGNWTREEAEAAKEDIYCKYHVNPVEVFDVFTTFLINRENIIWIDPAVRAGLGIPKMYFEYAAGDIIMCGYRDSNMCPNLLKKGVFEAPLKHGTVPRVGTTISSALKYCYEMLEEGGICDKTLPSTYTVWKKSSQDQCFGSGFSGFVYKHPETGREKSLLEVSYDATQDYQKAERSTLFMLYKACVILVLVASVFTEAKELIPLGTMIMSYPAASELKSQGKEVIEVDVDPDDDDNVTYRIRGFTAVHRTSVAMVVLARSIMFFVLLLVGVIFLLKETDYLNLILNGLGLLFVVTLPGELYHQLLSPYLRAKVENVVPIEVKMSTAGCMDSLNRRPALKDVLWIAVMLVFVVVAMVSYRNAVVAPVTQALKCACLSEGEHCREAISFSGQFWDDYWKNRVPAAIREIRHMEKSATRQVAKRSAQPPPSPTTAAPSTVASPVQFYGDKPRLKLKRHRQHYVHLQTEERIIPKGFF